MNQNSAKFPVFRSSLRVSLSVQRLFVSMPTTASHFQIEFARSLNIKPVCKLSKCQDEKDTLNNKIIICVPYICNLNLFHYLNVNSKA